MTQGAEAFHFHGFHHAKCRQWIHETGGAFCRCDVFMHDKALLGLDSSELSVHGAAQYADSFPD